MNNVVLCPNCGGAKTVSKPPYIAGDVNSWVSSSMETFPCPTCDGRGWVRVDSVAQDDFDVIKLVALGVMDTAENLMDECVKRADRIKELESTIHELEADRIYLKNTVNAFRAVVSERDIRITDLETQREFVSKTRDLREEELLGMVDDLVAERERDKVDLELLDNILKIMNPLIKSGNYAQPMAYYQLLSRKMNELCKTVVQFRRKHNIVG